MLDRRVGGPAARRTVTRVAAGVGVALAAAGGSCGSSDDGGLTGAVDAGADTSAAGGSGGSAGSGGGGTVACSSDKDCTDLGLLCDPSTSVCVECVTSGDCAGGERCESGSCTEVQGCENSLDCVDAPGNRKVCDSASGECVECVAPADCPDDNDCTANECVPFTPCVNSLDCPTGEVCDVDRGRCVECVANGDCDDGEVCAGNVCRAECDSDNDCTPLGQLCDKTAGHCVDCLANADCAPAEHCAQGVCMADVCTPGESRCSGNAIATCLAAGDGFGTPVPCPGGSTCTASGGQAECAGTDGGTGGTSGAGGIGGTSGMGGTAGAAGTAGTGGMAGTGGAAGTGGTAGAGGTAGSGGTAGTGGVCNPVTQEAQQTDAALVVMFDHSGSMNGAKIDALKNGLSTWVQENASSGLGVALHEFPVSGGGGSCPATCTTNADCAPCGSTCFISVCLGAADSCDPADYATPTPAYGLLPGAASGLVAQISSFTDTGGSPIAAALEGAIDGAQTVASNNPSTEVAVILTADGEANTCTVQDVPGIAMIAAAGLAATPSIRTHVIQFDLTTPSMNPIATAGGTTPWPRIDENSPSQVAILDTLRSIRRVERDCKFSLPSVFSSDPPSSLVVELVTSSTTQLTRFSDAFACGGGPGYYEVPGRTGRKLVLCPASCAQAVTDPSPQVMVSRVCL